MAVTTIGGGIRALVVADGVVNARAWQDDAPEGATFPYVTINDAITTGRALVGDGATIMLDRQAQLDLWERIDEEDAENARRLYLALDGARVALDGSAVMRLRVTDSQRILEQDTNIAHRILTLAVSHDRAAF